MNDQQAIISEVEVFEFIGRLVIENRMLKRQIVQLQEQLRLAKKQELGFNNKEWESVPVENGQEKEAVKVKEK